MPKSGNAGFLQMFASRPPNGSGSRAPGGEFPDVVADFGALAVRGFEILAVKNERWRS